MSERRSTRTGAGKSPARLGHGDGWSETPAAAWSSEPDRTTPSATVPAAAASITPTSTTSTITKPRGGYLNHFRSLKQQFGAPFLTVICTVYFSQGFRSLASLSTFPSVSWA
jgi:hypothetical protein